MGWFRLSFLQCVSAFSSRLSIGSGSGLIVSQSGANLSMHLCKAGSSMMCTMTQARACFEQLCIYMPCSSQSAIAEDKQA